MSKSKKSHHEPPGFFDKPKNIRKILHFFYSACVILVLLDFVVHRHVELAVEKLPGFYALYGFVACVLLVLLATQMRKIVMRKENYYLDSQRSSNKHDQKRIQSK